MAIPPLMASGTAAVTAPTSTLLPGQSPPLAALTDTNRSGIVLITTSLCLIFALLSITIRLYVRLQFRHQIDRDDFASFVSMVRQDGCCFAAILVNDSNYLPLVLSQMFSFIQSVIVLVQAGSGFGKSSGELSEPNMISWQKVRG